MNGNGTHAPAIVHGSPQCHTCDRECVDLEVAEMLHYTFSVHRTDLEAALNGHRIDELPTTLRGALPPAVTRLLREAIAGLDPESDGLVVRHLYQAGRR